MSDSFENSHDKFRRKHIVNLCSMLISEVEDLKSSIANPMLGTGSDNQLKQIKKLIEEIEREWYS